MKQLDIDWDAIYKRPRKISGDIRVPKYGTLNIEDRVLKFLKSYSSIMRLGLKWGDLLCTVTTPTLTGKIIKYQQIFRGKPVQDAVVIVKLNETDRIKSIQISPAVISSSLFNLLGRFAPPSLINIISLVSGLPISQINDPDLTQNEAIQIAIKSVGINPGEIRGNCDVSKPSIMKLPGHWRWNVVYCIFLPTIRPAFDWQVIINAKKSDPRIFLKRNVVMSVPVKMYTHLSIPSPIVEFLFQDPDLLDPRAKAQGMIDKTQAKELELSVSGNNVTLSGPYVEIRQLDNHGFTPIKKPLNTAGTYFDGITIGTDDYHDVMTYYCIDQFQRFLQNYKLDNIFHRGYPIPVDTHADAIGAWWTYDYLCHLGRIYFGKEGQKGGLPGFYPPAEDGEAIIHEYIHAIFSYQSKISNMQNQSDEVRAINEGYANFLPCAYFATDFPTDADVFMDWCEYIPYDPKIASPPEKMYVHWVDPKTKSDPIYPSDLDAAKGFLWSTVLWKIFKVAGGVDTNDAVRREDIRKEIFQATITSIAGIYSYSKIPDAAEMLMEEDAALPIYHGRLLRIMLDEFHNSGIFEKCESPDVYIKQTDIPSDVSLPLDEKSRPRKFDIWTEKMVHDDGSVHVYLCAKIRNRKWYRGNRVRALVVTFSIVDSNGMVMTTTINSAYFRLRRWQIVRTEMPGTMKPTNRNLRYSIRINIYCGKYGVGVPQYESNLLPQSAFEGH